MGRISFICVLIFIQVLGCLSKGSNQDFEIKPQSLHALMQQEKGKVKEDEPTIGEYVLEAVDLLNRTDWRFYLPDDIDIDQDGRVSDLEVQHKFNSYLGELFNLVDHDKNKIILEEELRSLKLSIPGLTKVVDIAVENFPLKPALLAADGNSDGFYDEDDFYMPVKENEYNAVARMRTGTNVEIRNNKVSIFGGLSVGKIGQNEGTVICKSLGFEGLKIDIPVAKHNSYSPVREQRNRYSSSKAEYIYTCDGTEARLEDCQRGYNYDYDVQGMGVTCEGGDELGPLKLEGGKDSSAGDIFFGSKIACSTPFRRWGRDKKVEAFYDVVCRELGFPGFAGITYDAAFTKKHYPSHKKEKTQFTCTGNEAKLADCQQTLPDYCAGGLVGVVCKTDTRPGIDENLSEIIHWRQTFNEVWEIVGRFLFFADANGDGKLIVEEMSKKAKELMTEILNFFDQNQDKHISMEDFTSLHLPVAPIHELITELFNDVTSGGGELDLYNLKVVGLDLGSILNSPLLRELDSNMDRKLNAADVFFGRHIRQKVTYLIPMLSQKLDTNQDGKIQRKELTLFIDDMFNQLDIDNNGYITLEDVYRLLRNIGLDCFQVGALRSYINIILNTVDTQIKNFMSYFFKQLDLDGNGEIMLKEFEKMKIPCAHNYDYGDFDPKDSHVLTCEWMFEHFFGNPFGDLRFPNLEMNSRRRDSYGPGGSGVKQELSILEKMTNHACEMLS